MAIGHDRIEKSERVITTALAKHQHAGGCRGGQGMKDAPVWANATKPSIVRGANRRNGTNGRMAQQQVRGRWALS